MEKPARRIGLKHGSGGRAMRRLIEETFLKLATPVDGIGLAALDDGAALRVGDRWLVVTTDSHVVKPAFFPGGDIGRLAVCGTVNDLAMMGTIGDHGMAIMSRRHDLRLEGDLHSDVAPLNGLVREVLRAGGDDVVAMKDPTRGGVAGVLHEMAAKAKVGIVLDEGAVPVRDEVRAAAEMIGIDPLLVANEGKAVIGVRPGA